MWKVLIGLIQVRFTILKIFWLNGPRIKKKKIYWTILFIASFLAEISSWFQAVYFQRETLRLEHDLLMMYFFFLILLFSTVHMLFMAGNDRKLSAHVCYFHVLTFVGIFISIVYCCEQKLNGEGSIAFKRQSAYWLGSFMVMSLSFNIFLVMAHLQMVNEEPLTNFMHGVQGGHFLKCPIYFVYGFIIFYQLNMYWHFFFAH